MFGSTQDCFSHFSFFKYRFRSTGLMRILVLSGMLRILKIPDSASSLAREENQTGFNCFDTKATVRRWCFISPWDLQNIYILKKCLKRCNNTTACIQHFTGVFGENCGDHQGCSATVGNLGRLPR